MRIITLECDADNASTVLLVSGLLNEPLPFIIADEVTREVTMCTTQEEVVEFIEFWMDGQPHE